MGMTTKGNVDHRDATLLTDTLAITKLANDAPSEDSSAKVQGPAGLHQPKTPSVILSTDGSK